MKFSHESDASCDDDAAAAGFILLFLNCRMFATVACSDRGTVDVAADAVTVADAAEAEDARSATEKSG